jgi:malonyl-CoA/methylmalonyl-CoA synthetase
MNTFLSSIPLIARAQSGDASRTAIIDSEKSYRYQDLLEDSARIATALLEGERDLNGARVAFLVPSAFDYPAVQWGIWRAGGIAVPLCTLHPASELAYVIEDSDAALIVAHPQYADTLRPVAAQLKRKLMFTDELRQATAGALPQVAPERAALMLYTSGTTGKPKGVVTTHENIAAQIAGLIEAWGWTENDHILLFLPLHHIHGVINVLSSALWAGAICEMLPRFDAETVWAKLQENEQTLFMAVPTIYTRLIAAWKNAPAPEQKAMTRAAKKLRLMVSGSAALPAGTLEEWRRISGHTLLERYGMTEIGMALSNPLNGERRPGSVGLPLPGVEVRLVDDNNHVVAEGVPGEIQVRGKNVFREYWRRPQATREVFAEDWFKTGDVAICENNAYRILGRNSVDIIKTGGYKVSALEIEETLRAHEAIAQCAVVGVADEEWGERVCAAVILEAEKSLDLGTLRHWARQHLAVYKVPSRLLLVDELPANAMGKVTKKEVARLFA